MIRRPGLPRRPAGPAGSDRETSPGIRDRARLAVRLRSEAPLRGARRMFERASLLHLLASQETALLRRRSEGGKARRREGEKGKGRMA